MRKLKLEIEGLAVDSFHAGPEVREAGTVQGRESVESLVECVKNTLATRMTCCPCTPAFLQ
jgi:hypothetical protein